MKFKKSKNAGQNIRIVDVKTTICLMLVVALFSTFNLNAQTVPEPPKPPKTNSVSSSTSTYAVEVNTDDNHYNSSVSISVSDDSYKFRASYHKSKNDGVKAMLLDQLGKDNLKVKGNTYVWIDSQSGGDVFECKLTNGHLKMFVDTEATSKIFADKMNTLGTKLKYYISGSDAKKEEAKTTERAKRELERAERELERAKREMARAEGDAKRAGKN